MPSKSAKQHRFMEMVAHDPAAAKRVGVPQSVGRDFANADKARDSHMKERRGHGLTHKEIGEEFGVHRSTAGRRLRRD